MRCKCEMAVLENGWWDVCPHRLWRASHTSDGKGLGTWVCSRGPLRTRAVSSLHRTRKCWLDFVTNSCWCAFPVEQNNSRDTQWLTGRRDWHSEQLSLKTGIRRLRRCVDGFPRILGAKPFLNFQVQEDNSACKRHPPLSLTPGVRFPGENWLP